MKKRLLLIVVAHIIACASTAIAYDQYYVHPQINKNALVQSRADNFLKNQLGFANGIKESINGKEITDWIMDGGKLEDETDCHSKFHFHDPTKPFGSAGLSNIAIDTYCLNYRHRSSLVKKGVAK